MVLLVVPICSPLLTRHVTVYSRLSVPMPITPRSNLLSHLARTFSHQSSKKSPKTANGPQRTNGHQNGSGAYGSNTATSAAANHHGNKENHRQNNNNNNHPPATYVCDSELPCPFSAHSFCRLVLLHHFCDCFHGVFDDCRQKFDMDSLIFASLTFPLTFGCGSHNSLSSAILFSFL